MLGFWPGNQVNLLFCLVVKESLILHFLLVQLTDSLLSSFQQGDRSGQEGARRAGTAFRYVKVVLRDDIPCVCRRWRRGRGVERLLGEKVGLSNFATRLSLAISLPLRRVRFQPISPQPRNEGMSAMCIGRRTISTSEGRRTRSTLNRRRAGERCWGTSAQNRVQLFSTDLFSSSQKGLELQLGSLILSDFPFAKREGNSRGLPEARRWLRLDGRFFRSSVAQPF